MPRPTGELVHIKDVREGDWLRYPAGASSEHAGRAGRFEGFNNGGQARLRGMTDRGMRRVTYSGRKYWERASEEEWEVEFCLRRLG